MRLEETDEYQTGKARDQRCGESVSCQDAGGDYRIAPVRQRPMLLIGPPGIGKEHRLWNRLPRVRDRACFLYHYAPHETERSRPSVYPKKDTFGEKEVSITEYTMSEIIASVYEKCVKPD